MELKALIVARMDRTKSEHAQVTQQLALTERKMTELSTKRVELAAVYNADEELLKSFDAQDKPIPDENVELEEVPEGKAQKKTK